MIIMNPNILKLFFPAKIFSKKVSQKENGIAIKARKRKDEGNSLPKKAGKNRYKSKRRKIEIIPSDKPSQKVLLKIFLSFS
jgi:hypothetical protein